MADIVICQRVAENERPSGTKIRGAAAQCFERSTKGVCAVMERCLEITRPARWLS
jgi:hypothetical protein